MLLDKFGAALQAESAGDVLTTATHWDDLEIQEEAESGSSVTSKIRLPVQVSAQHPGDPSPAQADHHRDPGGETLVSPAGVMVCAITALPAVRGGEQGGRSCSATAHPAGAAPGLLRSGPAALPRPHAAASWNSKANANVGGAVVFHPTAVKDFSMFSYLKNLRKCIKIVLKNVCKDTTFFHRRGRFL